MELNSKLPAAVDTFAVFPAAEKSSSVREKTALNLERIAFFGMLATVALTAIPYGTVEPWWEAAFISIVFALTALRIAHALLTGHAQVRGLGLFLPALCVCAFALLQVLPIFPSAIGSTISTDPHETTRFIFKLLAFISAGELLLRFTNTRSRFVTLVYAVIGIGVASALFGLIRQFTQTEGSFLLSGLTAGTGYGQFINVNHFAFLMEMTLGVLAGLIVGGGIESRRRPVAFALALLVWLALVFTNSRGGVISMFALVLFIGFVRTNQKFSRKTNDLRARRSGWLFNYGGALRSAAALVALGLILLVAVVWVGGDSVASRMETVSGEVSFDTTDKIRRIEIWQATWPLIKDHPLAGVGFGGYWTAMPRYFSGSGEWSLQQAHNDYLEIVASGGLIGTLLFLWFIVAVVLAAVKSRVARDPLYKATRLGALAGLVAVAVHSFVDFGLHTTINGIVFVILIVIISTSDNSRANELRHP